MSFVHCTAPKTKPSATDECLIIQGDQLLTRTDTSVGVQLPAFGELMAWPEKSTIHSPLHVGLFNNRPLWLYAIGNAAAIPPVGWQWTETRSLLGTLTTGQLQAISCARELSWWQSRNRYCGHCGTPTVDAGEERAKRCPSCNALFFPIISPAVIIAITRGDQILLGHNRNFRPGMFSLLAGFVDPGETLEQSAVREVREEVGIEITDLRYISSQPWPFPNSLMAGFRATHRSGEIVVDGKEIEQAGWFTRDALPEIPRPGTVARSLIDAWLSE